ncbi:MAG: DUF2971 domain-containing protein [Terracidiphilus sp.]|jgi:hypothetical protein
MWIGSFVDCLEESTLSHPRFEEAYAIKQQNIPKRIYKYRRDCDYSRANLRTDTVWLSSPDSYNDPYDCAFAVLKDSKDIVMAAAIKVIFDEITDACKYRQAISIDVIEKAKASREPLRSIAEYMSTLGIDIESQDPHRWAERSSVQLNGLICEIDATLNLVRRNAKVCSFSAISDSILMWSHYADNHRGFCVEYDLDPLVPNHPFRRNLYPVIYSPDLYDLTPWLKSLVDSDLQQFNSIHPLLALIHKFDGWGYEQEWRLALVLPTLIEDHDLKVPRPIRIFLGSKMEHTNKNELRAICEEKGIEVWQMQMADDKYRLFAERQH